MEQKIQQRLLLKFWKKRDNTLFLQFYSSGTRDVRWANGPQGMMKKSACQINIDQLRMEERFYGKN